MGRRLGTIARSGPAPELTVLTRTPLAASAPQDPVVVVTANLHGDECTGIGVCLALAESLEAELLRGTVHLYPSLNPEGLERRTRRHPDDDVDLNRLFPGDAAGGPAERLVHAVWTDIAARQPALVIDLHADAPAAVPYVVTDRAIALSGPARTALEGACARLGAATGLTVLQDYPDDRYARYRLDRSLTGAVLNRLRVPALTVEAGPRLLMDPIAVETTIRAVRGALAALGMVAGSVAADPSRVEGAYRRDTGPRAGAAGVLRPRVTPGVRVRRGELLAEIVALSGAVVERVRADADGFVVAFAERAHVGSGVPVCTFGFQV